MKRFFELIDRLNACPHAERPRLEAELMRLYRREKAVVALDMSGFSLNVRRSGVTVDPRVEPLDLSIARLRLSAYRVSRA